MKILLIEPYYTGSHRQWAEGYQRYSEHEIKIIFMKGQFWKWRMHGGAVTLAKEFNELEWDPDCILVSDMLDLSTFLALSRKISSGIATAVYFHENQLSYPWSPSDRDIQKNRDTHYGFINYASALAADKLFFNSEFHMVSFIDALQNFLKQFPDHRELSTINKIHDKSSVLHLGLDLSRFDKYFTKKEETPIILWNHRWEYDKNPETFFDVIKQIKNNGFDFKLAVLGENFSQSPDIFNKAKKSFKDNIVHWGYVESFEDYATWLWKADIIPVTSHQEFFGASVMEAIYCNTWPILPKRLTYPELIPVELHDDHIYLDNKDLFNRIIWAIDNIEIIRNSNISSAAIKYNWKKMAKVYDLAIMDK